MYPIASTQKLFFELNKLLAAGEKMGLEGEELKKFVTQQKTWKREERVPVLKNQKMAAEVELEQKRMELEIARIQGGTKEDGA